MSGGTLVLAYAVFLLALLTLPGAGVTLYAARNGVRDTVTLLAIGLVASGAAAMLAFWAYFADHPLGIAVSFGLPLTGALLLWRCGRALGRSFDWAGVGTPVVLWALGTLFLLCLGFLYGGTHVAVALARLRFSHPLPADNVLPQYFGESIYRYGHTRVPAHFSSWLSSDRPPLQMGYYVAARPFASRTNQAYFQVLGVALQQLWIIGMCALLEATHVRTRTRMLVLTAALVSDIAIIQGFFTWPKLIAVGFLLCGAAFVFSDRWTTMRSKPGIGLLVASLFALALLCHGTSVYAIVPLALFGALRGRPTWQWVITGVVAAAVLYAPWMAYQKYFDPPGTQLVKSQVAEMLPNDHGSVLQTIITTYRRTGLHKALDHRVRNINAVTGGWSDLHRDWTAISLAAKGKYDAAISTMRNIRFFSLMQVIGLLWLAPIFVFIPPLRRRPRSADEWRFARTAFAIAAAGCALWVIVQFGTDQSITYLHVGSFALPMLLIMACVTALAAVSQRLATALVGVNGVLVLVLYVPSLRRLPGGTGFSWLLAVIGTACLAGFIALAAHGARGAHGASGDAEPAPGMVKERTREATVAGAAS
jgi:hypothetical protein